MNHERTKAEAHADLLTLRNFLLDLPHSKFYMPRWSSPDATETSCGTAGCACGWAATIFHQKGLKFGEHYNYASYRYGREPVYGNLVGGDAFARFFEINREDARTIVSPWFEYEKDYGVDGEDITPTHVADRITRIGKRYAPDLAWDDAPAVNDLAAELALHTAESTGVESLAIERAMSAVDEESLKASVLSRPDRFDQE